MLLGVSLLLDVLKHGASEQSRPRVTGRVAASSTIASTRAGIVMLTRMVLPDSFARSMSTSAQMPSANSGLA